MCKVTNNTFASTQSATWNIPIEIDFANENTLNYELLSLDYCIVQYLPIATSVLTI